MFINVCHHGDVAEASGTAGGGGGGQHWSIPHNISPPRMEKDKGGAPCLTFDVVVHPNTLARAAVQKPFKDMLCKVRGSGCVCACLREGD